MKRWRQWVLEAIVVIVLLIKYHLSEKVILSLQGRHKKTRLWVYQQEKSLHHLHLHPLWHFYETIKMKRVMIQQMWRWRRMKIRRHSSQDIIITTTIIIINTNIIKGMWPHYMLRLFKTEADFTPKYFFLFFLENKASNFHVHCQSSRPFARNIHPYFLRKNKISSAAIVTGSLRVMVWLCSLIVRAAPCGNVSVSICRQQRPRSACASMQSDQGIHCPQTESLDTIECFNGEQMPNYSFDMAQLLLKSFEGRCFLARLYEVQGELL